MAETISIQIIEEAITITIDSCATWSTLSGKPAVYPADATQAATFANPLALDATTHKDFKCSLVSGNTTVNLTNATDGDAGLIELIISGAGGYTIALGTMFTKNSGGGTIDTTAAADNIIVWYKSGTDIIYSISQIS